jgi:surfeit locus 1 family protein
VVTDDYRSSVAAVDDRTSGRLAQFGYAAAALCVCACFATLGAWQYGRGVDKQQRLAQQALALQPGHEQPLDDALRAGDESIASVTRTHGTLRFRRPLLLLDGQQREGRVGVRVYAVADVDTPGPRLLVDAGWLPLAGDRTMPAPVLPAGQVQVAGLLSPWPGQGLRAAASRWPSGEVESILLTYLDRGEIEHAFATTLHARVLRLDPTLPFGFARDLDALPNTLPPERHFGYAVQWFALATAVVVVYLVLLLRHRRRKSR